MDQKDSHFLIMKSHVVLIFFISFLIYFFLHMIVGIESWASQMLGKQAFYQWATSPAIP